MCCGGMPDGSIRQMYKMRVLAMIIIGVKLLKTILLILMSLVRNFSLLQISSVLMSPYRGGMYRVVIGYIWFSPMYMAMDRNPDNGTEIHNSA